MIGPSARRGSSVVLDAVRTALVDVRHRSGRDDTGLAIGSAGLCVVAVAITAGVGRSGHSLGPALLLLGGAVLPAVLAVRNPLLGWRMCWLTGLLAPFVPAESRLDVAQLAIETALFCVAAVRCGRSATLGMWLLDVVSLWVWAADGSWRTRLVLTGGLTLVAVTVDALAGWRGARRALQSQTELTEAETARRAVLEERARIAREMHDIVAHHLSLIAVRTSTAEYRLDDVSPAVRDEFTALHTSAREALDDTRSLLGTLRGDETADRTPQPSLADLDALVATARAAGMRVRLTTTGSDEDVRASVALAAFRVVQEALSNAARHAPGSTVAVALHHDPGRTEVRVTNRGATGAAERITSVSGHGLSGMHERVTLAGGRLRAGPTPDGFEVVADLPAHP